MLSKIHSSAVLGLDAFIVEVETHLENGLPIFTIVGLPDSSVKESKERINAAIKNSGFIFPLKKITINLAPANIKKAGSSYDLPIAIAILAASSQIEMEKSEQYLILGELALDGSLRPIRGSLPVSIMAGDLNNNIKGIILPIDNAQEASVIPGIEVIGVKTLKDVVDFLNDEKEISPAEVDIRNLFNEHSIFEIDFEDVKGQYSTKRALEIAAAGGHNVLMIGPPGSGKSMLSKRFRTILPDMTIEEAIETTKIYSVAGLLPEGVPLISKRPFRSPHHSISDSALVGGGRIPHPGEISLAHNGVLFLDELPEFKKNVLEVLRQPLEDREVTIARAASTLNFPANFTMIVAMNPCPCGYYGDSRRECSCTPSKIENYIGKISGPLLDRIDIHIEVPVVKYEDLSQTKTGENSNTIRKRVILARKIQLNRFQNSKIYANSSMTEKDMQKYCQLDSGSHTILKKAIEKLSLSARAYNRILKVARTIADLNFSNNIAKEHVAEAIQYRTLDRKYI